MEQDMEKLDTLIVGAGPVGLTTALCLARGGEWVAVLEERDEHDPPSGATLLSPESLRLLAELELLPALEPFGRRIERVVLHVGHERCGTVTLARPEHESAHGLVLPQSLLERGLRMALEDAGVYVRWRHEVVELDGDPSGPRVVVRHHDGADTQAKTVVFSADYVVGADGVASVVRRATGIASTELEPAQRFGLFEARLEHDLGNDAHLALTDGAVSGLWPMRGARGRFAFELDPSNATELDIDALAALVAQQMSWLPVGIRSLESSSMLELSQRVVSRFGDGHVWLAGASAHMSSPLGAHCLNVGLREARRLAQCLHALEQGLGSTDALASYDRDFRFEWSRLLGSGSHVRMRERASPLLARHLDHLVASLPLAGEDLAPALDSLSLALH